MKWSEEEKKLLTEIWSDNPKTFIMEKFPNRSYSQVKSRAIALGLKKNISSWNGSILPFLKENPVAWYWIGFSLADGSIGKSYRCVIKDKEHLEKLASFLQTQIHIFHAQNYPDNEYWLVNVADKKNLKILKDKYDFKKSKIYNPPCIDLYDSFSDDKFLSILLGFIDGDGCITKNKTIQLLNHVSYLTFYELISRKIYNLYNITVQPSITKQGHSFLYIPRKVAVQLREFGQSLKLPLLDRKWSRLI